MNEWASMFIGPLTFFESKFEFDISAGVSSKIEKCPHLILLSLVYISIAPFYFKPGYFALFCLFFNPELFQMRVGD